MDGKWTPGPWAWMGNGKHDIYLATTHSGRRYVMGFRRMGLQGAQPVFQVNQRMVPASELLQFDVGDQTVVGIEAAKSDDSVYRYDIRSIAAADARLIAAAPTMAEELEWIAAFAAMRAGDDSKTFAVVNRGALRTIAERARQALSQALSQALGEGK